MQVLNRAHRQRSKSLGVLVLCANTFAQKVVKRFVKRNWYQISSLNGTLGIHHRITKRQRHILNRRECEHICRHKLIHWAIILEHAIGGLFYVIIGRICDIRHQPSMEIVELKPLAWCQLQRNHRHGRRTLREDIRGMISVSPLDILALDTDTTPPCVQTDSTFGVGEVATIGSLFVLHTRHGQQCWLLTRCTIMNLCTIHLIVFTRVILRFQPITIP